MGGAVFRCGLAIDMWLNAAVNLHLGMNGVSPPVAEKWMHIPPTYGGLIPPDGAEGLR